MGFFFQIERKRCDTSEDAYCWVWLQVPSIKARIWSWRSKSKKQCKSTSAIALSNCIIWRCIVLCTYVYIFREFQLDYTGPQPKDSLSGVESLWALGWLHVYSGRLGVIVVNLCFFTMKIIKIVKVFPFSFWKIMIYFFFTSNPWHNVAKWPPSNSTPWTLILPSTFSKMAIV